VWRCSSGASDPRPSWKDEHCDPLLIGLLVVLALLAMLAILAPANNWDSMVYHMGRVVHWMQNRSVDHYPTSIDRQLYLGPLTEFAILQLQMLSGED
jgi:hypothetical protein